MIAGVGLSVVVDGLSEAIILLVEDSVVAPHLNVEAGVLDPKIDDEDVELEPPNLKGLDVEPKVDVVILEEVCSGGLKKEDF